MATPSIGSIQFTSLIGRVTKPGKQPTDITWPGMDGHGYFNIGKRAPLSQLITLCDLDSAGAAESHHSDCVDIKGSLQTVTYADGQNDTNVAIVEVVEVSVNHVKSAVGGLGSAADRYVVTHRWTVHKVT